MALGNSLRFPTTSASIDSLEMIGQGLKDTITELSVPQTEVKLISKALTTIVNEHLFAKAREIGLNEAAGGFSRVCY